MTRKSLVWRGVVLCALVLGGCRGDATRDSEAASEHAAPASSPQAVLAELEARHGSATWPVRPDLVRTSSGEIYLGNLDSGINALSLRSDPAAARDQAALLAYRYRIRGRIEDAESALVLVESYLVGNPADRSALLLRASLLSGFHRFEEARRDLESLVSDEPAAQRLLDEMDLAGDGHSELAQRLAGRDSDAEGLFELALRGNLAVQQGDAGAAEKWFRLAQSRYGDVSPMPLAWLHTQQGIALLRAGNIERANLFFAAAHARLPQYYLATEHLAETEFLLGRHARALELYQSVVAQTDHPEFHAAISGVLTERGEHTAAADHLRRAHAGYASLLARHASAFADHAAGFYLEQGNHARALELAQLNVAARPGVMAWLLLAEVQQAMGDASAACSALQQARRSGLRPPELKDLQELLPHC